MITKKLSDEAADRFLKLMDEAQPNEYYEKKYGKAVMNTIFRDFEKRKNTSLNRNRHNFY